MEQLINKEWYEFDFKTMKPDESRYVRYTGTQRLEVSADEDGNTRMRVQKYYLSYEWEERFDSRKVGKYRNGKYIVIRGERDTSNVEVIKTICLEIMKLTDNKLNIKNLSDFDLPRNFYVTIDENDDVEMDDISEKMGFSVRTMNCLRRAGFTPVKFFELMRQPGLRERELLKIRNMGDNGVAEIINKTQVVLDYHDRHKKEESSLDNPVSDVSNSTTSPESSENLESLNAELLRLREEMQNLTARTDAVLAKIQQKMMEQTKGGVLK